MTDFDDDGMNLPDDDLTGGPDLSDLEAEGDELAEAGVGDGADDDMGGLVRCIRQNDSRFLQRVFEGVDQGTPVVYAPPIWALVMLVIRHLPRAVMRKVGF